MEVVGGPPYRITTLTPFFCENMPTLSLLKPLNYFSQFSWFGVQGIFEEKQPKTQQYLLKKQSGINMAYRKGESGNPAGRPKGQTPGAQIRKAIEERKDKILQAVIDAAIGGDMTACKMLLDRITPTLKPQTVPITLPVNESLTAQGNEIIKATMTGQIPPDIGSQLITALTHQVKIIEIDELVKRIDALEKRT